MSKKHKDKKEKKKKKSHKSRKNIFGEDKLSDEYPSEFGSEHAKLKTDSKKDKRTKSLADLANQ